MGLVGLGLMVALTILYREELGWGLIAAAWIGILGVGLLSVVLNGWIVLLIQATIIGGLYMKAKA